MIAPVLRTNVPRAIRLLRRRRRWRQSDLAMRALTSRQVISRLERGELGPSALRTIVRVVEALEASVDLTLRWQGEELDRLADAAHARLVQATAAVLGRLGWQTRVEVSFNHYGDRGRVDVLAFHPGRGLLLVTEVKSGIGDIQDTVGRIDVKARLGRVLAEAAGWPAPVSVVPVLVVGDSRRARRIVAEHDVVFARFASRGRQALAWLRRPSGLPPSGLLWFVNLPNAHGTGITRHGRVRPVKKRS